MELEKALAEHFDGTICELACDCSPGLKNSIAQQSKIQQKAGQKQEVSMKQTFGFGAILAAAAGLAVIFFCFCFLKGKLSCCMKCRRQVISLTYFN